MRTWLPLLLVALLSVAAAIGSAPRIRHELRSWVEARGWASTYRESGAYARRIAAFEQENRRLAAGCVILLGDSLVEGFPDTDLQALGGINRGISGDRVRHVRLRLVPSALDTPCRDVALCVGTNDLMHEIATPEQVAREIHELAVVLASAGRRVWVHTLPPSEPPLEWLGDPIRQTNTRLRERLPGADASIQLLDLHATLVEAIPDGARTLDGIHLHPSAYRHWFRLLSDARTSGEQRP